MAWRPGEVVQWREVWRDRVLFTMPVEVVTDHPELLALYIAEGTPFSFPDPWPWAPAHPWAAGRRWRGHGALVLHRPSEPYTAWAFWQGAKREFAGWYINFQRPFARTPTTVDTFDHEVDIVIAPDGTWQYKDLDLLDECVNSGRFTAHEATAIRATAEEVAGQLKEGRRWWAAGWETWQQGDHPPDVPT